MDGSEKRKFTRLGADFNLSCSKIGLSVEHFYSGRTINVSPGGLYFQTEADAFEPGSLLKVDMSIPPTPGLLEFGGRISAFGRVLRTDAIKEFTPGKSGCGVALEFCRSPKLCI